MSRRGISRIGVLAALGWATAVVLAGSIAWRAVAVIDPETGAAGVLSQAQVDAALAEVLATAPPLPPSPSTTPSPVAPPAEVVRSWSVTGGTVAATCQGTAITLLYATPSDGWTVEVKAAGPEELLVELESEGDETAVRAVCVAGTPEPSVESRSEDEGSSPAAPSTQEPSDEPDEVEVPDESTDDAVEPHQDEADD